MKTSFKKTLSALVSAGIIAGYALVPGAMPLAGNVAVTAGAEEEYTSGDYTYEVKDFEAAVTKYNGSGGDVVIPPELDGYDVTSIGSKSFHDCAGLESLTIPEGVTKIGEHAFEHCLNLKEITLPDSLISIGEYAFCS